MIRKFYFPQVGLKNFSFQYVFQRKILSFVFDTVRLISAILKYLDSRYSIKEHLSSLTSSHF
jgi:hypothetical protein